MVYIAPSYLYSWQCTEELTTTDQIPIITDIILADLPLDCYDKIYLINFFSCLGVDEALALHTAYMLLRDPLLLLDELLHNPSDSSTYHYDVS